MAKRAHALACALLVACLILVYGRAGQLGWLHFDDFDYVVRNDWVRAGLTADGVLRAFTSFYMSNWHPLTWLSHMLDVSLFGLAPGPQHLVNVALHGANSLLLYLFALALLRHWLAAVLVAALFLVHPLHVESVAWIAERKDLLCAFFFLLSLLAYLRYVARPGPGTYAAVLGLFVLALLSKPMAVTLPLVLLLLDVWPLGRHRQAALPLPGARMPAPVWLLLEKLPLLALSLASGLVTLAAQTGAIVAIEQVAFGQRLMNAALACVTYLRDTVAPMRLAMIYPLRPVDFLREFLPALLLLVAISALTFLWRRRQPWLLGGWLWFLVTLLPVIGLVQVGVQSHADRYMYLPSIGLFLALGALMARLSATASRRALLALVPALAFYSAIAWVQLGYWSGGYMAFTRVLEVTGESVVAHSRLSAVHLRDGRVDLAENHARRALALDPRSPTAYLNLGVVLLHRSDHVGAEKMFRTALSRSRTDARVLNALGVALENQGRTEEARQSYAAALASDPNSQRARENLKRLGG